MFAKFKRKKFLLLVLLLASGLALFAYLRPPPRHSFDFLGKFQDRLVSAQFFLTELRAKFFSPGDEDAGRLQEENIQLRQRLTALEEEKKTWEGWQQIRGNLYEDIPRGTAARVVAGDASVRRRSVTLDKGRAAGLREGQVVLAQGGLVGRVVRVTEHTGQVLLLTDPFSVVDVLAQSSRSRGTLKGERDASRLGGEYFLAREPLQVGDLLLTSGQDGLFPKGIPVGTVRHLQKDESEIFFRAQVEPSVEMNKLEIVEVISSEFPLSQGERGRGEGAAPII